jgi:hypothetical protein
MPIKTAFDVNPYLLPILYACCKLFSIQKMENSKAVIEINFSSKPCRGNIAIPPIVLRIASRSVVQAGQPGVKAANVLPKAVELLLPLMAINLEPLILKINSAMLIPANIAVTNVSAKENTIYDVPIISTTEYTGTIESVR